MQLDSLKELYSSKTDDELLSLAAERDSLTAIARVALADGLHRRNLSDSLQPPPVEASLADSELKSSHRTGSDRGSGIVWLGLFLINTLLVYACALHVSEMLVGRWFAWFAPIFNTPSNVAPADWYLQHLELVTIITAFVGGYIDLGRFLPALVGRGIAARRPASAATWVWILPTAELLYKMLQFRAPSSVLFGSSMSAFKYFFDIQKVMPTFANPLASDPIRVLAQMSVTAPFYAGVAYSLGALASEHGVLTTLFTFKRHTEPTSPQ